jgi:hypothetical protein
VSRAVGLSQNYTDADRETLNDAGICLAKLVRGSVQTYGYRTAAGPDDVDWLWFSNSRVVMTVSHRGDAIGGNYVLQQIDGQGQTIAKFEAELRGMLLDLYSLGALYGSTPEEAFTVDTGPGVNTIETIAAGELHAVIKIKTSPAAEWVVVSIAKVAVTQSIAA